MCTQVNQSPYALKRLDQADRRDLYLVNMQNEVVGYHLVGVVPLVAGVVLGLCSWC